MSLCPIHAVCRYVPYVQFVVTIFEKYEQYDVTSRTWNLEFVVTIFEY
jgi:hypothetical protein